MWTYELKFLYKFKILTGYKLKLAFVVTIKNF